MNIRPLDEPAQNLRPALGFQVQRHGALAAVDAGVVAAVAVRKLRLPAAVLVALRAFHLNDVRPHVGELLGAERACQHAAQVGDDDSLQDLHGTAPWISPPSEKSQMPRRLKSARAA